MGRRGPTLVNFGRCPGIATDAACHAVFCAPAQLSEDLAPGTYPTQVVLIFPTLQEELHTSTEEQRKEKERQIQALEGGAYLGVGDVARDVHQDGF